MFRELLDAAVQVSDHGDGFDHRFAGQVKDQPENAVRRRVLRAHVERELAEVPFDDFDRAAAHDSVSGSAAVAGR